MINDLINKLNAENAEKRLGAAARIAAMIENGSFSFPEPVTLVNNHIHTTFSFSPYSPTSAVFRARMAGLLTAGICDHDSVGGALEFIEAGKIFKTDVTCAMELRVSLAGTPFADRRVNNPDQKGCAYVAIHGIPHQNIDKVEAFIAPYRKHRHERNRAMTANINAIFAKFGISLDYDSDILPISEYKNGGGVTERHILFALTKKINEAFGRGEAAVKFLSEQAGLNISEKLKKLLSDKENPFYDYDLLGLLKAELVSRFYIPASDELPPISEAAAFADSIGAICAYAYLGDVGNSVTGDKKSQTFEDEYLDELFEHLKKWGFKAVTYMPSRNTREQLARVMALCEKHGFFQISGEDINTPRQSFLCEALREDCYAHLSDAAWALIGHESRASRDLSDGIFSAKNSASYPDIKDRVRQFCIAEKEDFFKRTGIRV